MRKIVLTKIFWLNQDEGGRSSLPAGDTYSAISRFGESKKEWLQEAWSIVFEFNKPASEQGSPSLARAKFLSDEAPVDKLKQGDSFEIFEGPHKVANVEVLIE